MILIQPENIEKSYGEKLLFTNVTFSINTGDKIALIAANGSGKTTLLNILIGTEIADKGEVIRMKDLTVGYLKQIPVDQTNLKIKDYLFHAGSPVADAILSYNTKLLEYETIHDEQHQKAFQHATEAMDALDGWNYERRFIEILGNFGIQDLSLLLSNLSGGQQKKVALAKLLAEEFDLLLLDEPTNHLDINMIEWLEEFLSTSTKTFLTVTHDRYFLDSVCNAIIEIDNQSIYQYNGNFAYFLEKKMERESSMQKEVEKFRNLYKTELEWMRRQPKARSTKQKARIDAFDDIKEGAFKNLEKKEVQLDIQSSRLGKKIIEYKDVSFAFPSAKILDNFTYTFRRGEKLGIVGYNGTGKTSFIELLTGNLKPQSGVIETGETIQFGYYKQNEDVEKHLNTRVIDYAKEIAEQVTLGSGKSISISQFLTQFLFEPDEQYSPIGKLSGGERKRLSLIKVLLTNPNFLILDEPTNDLDIQTLSILEDFLIDFAGCVIIVSHDRHFLDKIVDHLFVFEGNGVINDYHTSYTQYRLEKKNEEREAIRAQKKEEPVKEVVAPKPQKAKLSYKEQKELEHIEAQLPILENKKAEIEQEMNNTDNSFDKIQALSVEYGKTNDLIDEMTMRWLEISES